MSNGLESQIVLGDTESFYPSKELSLKNNKTDLEIFGKDEPLTIKTKGRPKINENLALTLFKAKRFSNKQIAKKLNCSTRTINRIKKRLIENGLLSENEIVKTADIVSADFRQECENATGYDFLTWLKNNRKSDYKRVYNFCRRTWEKVFDRPSLILVKDPTINLGDLICQKFLNTFGDDLDRIRRRKKLIRQLFRFLGRGDLNDRHLRTTGDKRNIRKVPHISFLNFPERINRIIEQISTENREWGIALRLKICGQFRTGNKGTDKELMGITVKDATAKSYLIMDNEDNYRFHILAKKDESWDINWLPKRVRQELYFLYNERGKGEKLFQFKEQDLRDRFGDLTKKEFGFRFILHDCRKISITWLWVMGLPLEIATELNIGWKDLNTAKTHYLQLRKLLKNSDRKIYKQSIPEWYKDGLDEYIKEND